MRSAPAARAAAPLVLEEAAAITSAPSAFPTSTAARPTPPAAPSTNSRSPRPSAPRHFSPKSAVPKVISKAAASCAGVMSGMGTHRDAGSTNFSARPPNPGMPMIRWPLRSDATPSPTASTTPATSAPGGNGRSGRTW